MNIPIEPKDGAFVRTGNSYPYDFWIRDDTIADDVGWTKGEHWWDATSDVEDPLPWDEIARMPSPCQILVEPITQEDGAP